MASAGRTAGHHLQEPLVEDHDWPTPVLQVKLCVAGFFVLGTVWLALDPKIGGALAILAAVLGTLLLRHDPGCRPCMNGIIGALPLPCPAVGLCGACEGGIACVTPFLIVSVATAISGLLYTLTLSSLDVSSIFIIRPFIALLTASLGVYAATLAWHIRNGDTTWRPYGGPGGPDYFEASVASAQLQRAESPPGLELPWEGSSQTQHRAAQPLRQQQQQQQQHDDEEESSPSPIPSPGQQHAPVSVSRDPHPPQRRPGGPDHPRNFTAETAQRQEDGVRNPLVIGWITGR